MDIKKNKKSIKWLNNKALIALLVAFSIALFYFIGLFSNAVSVQRSELLLGKVQKGNLDVTVAGYGNLRSKNLQLLTAATDATVKEILLQPGAVVNPQSVVVRLENPELAQQFENIQQELTLGKANLRQLIINQQREMLDETGKVADLNARYETAKLKRRAEQKLLADGIVSELDFQASELNESQLQQRLSILKQRMNKLKDVHLEAINIQNEIIKQQEGRLAIAADRLEKLEVKAQFDGVLQKLPVQLGQRLSAGQEIALIGSVDELIGIIRVPQNQAQAIVIGQTVAVDTRQDIINGSVSRIDPVVEDNTVSIEVALPQKLPASARPELSIDGMVIVDKLTDITYIERPPNVEANSKGQLFLLDEAEAKAYITPLTYGRQAGRYIEITNGAEIDQEFVLSGMPRIAQASTVVNLKL